MKIGFIGVGNLGEKAVTINVAIKAKVSALAKEITEIA